MLSIETSFVRGHCTDFGTLYTCIPALPHTDKKAMSVHFCGHLVFHISNLMRHLEEPKRRWTTRCTRGFRRILRFTRKSRHSLLDTDQTRSNATSQTASKAHHHGVRDVFLRVVSPPNQS